MKTVTSIETHHCETAILYEIVVINFKQVQFQA